MGRIVSQAIAVVLAGCVALGAAAQDHVVSRGRMETALQASRALREQGIGSIERFLDSRAAADAARRVGADLPSLRRSLALLEDTQVRDLSRHAEALSQGAVSGQAPKANSNPINALILVGIFLVVAIVVAVSIAD